MMDEFNNIPLAERVRPSGLDDFIGQSHLTGKNKPIRIMVDNDKLSSFILWGPPGTGKTTLAKIISNSTNCEFYSINAVSSGVKEIRKIIELAKLNIQNYKRTVLFIDEIHRFNKSQQDALLSSVESGELILIGATTENPSFEVISALRSRCRIFTLNSLGKDELLKILDLAVELDVIVKKYNINEIDKDYLVFISGGDARILLNTFEACLQGFDENKNFNIDKKKIDDVIQNKNIFYDKNGEEHYNLISAFIKSVRGSDPDASLFWLARMLEGGEDPLFIARRLIVLASEDIGNASPNGLVLAEAAFNAVHSIGMPEARIILSQCTTYLASSPKSNASYVAIKKAYEEVKKNPDLKVPLHLRNAPTKLMKSLGYGKNYKYSHNYENNFIEEGYFPEEIANSQYYFPTENGQEKKLLDYLKSIWKKKKKY